MPPRSRPGPLQELDLAFVPVPSSSSTPSAYLRPNKRPHSPSVGAFDSPAKRRLKGEEGVYVPKVKSPLSGSTNSARFAPAYFHALLQGPDSPAKRLDFGSSEASDSTVCEVPLNRRGGLGTPRRSPRRTSLTRVSRSPRLSARVPSSPPGSPGPAINGQTGTDAHSAAIRAYTTAPLTVPRVVTTPDRQSIHYPGFDVYQDPYIIVPSARSLSSPEDIAYNSSASDKEHDKENVAPRRKSSKKLSYPTTPSVETDWVKLLSPSASGKDSVKKPIPASPHPKHVCDYFATSLTMPKEHTLRSAVSPAATLVGVTPGRTPLGKEERKQMRRAMENEVDEVDGDDDLML